MEGGWSGAELATTNTAPPSAEAEHLPAPASSPDPGAGRGPARTTLHSIDFCFRFPQRQRVSGVQAPGSRPALLGTDFHQLGRGATAGVLPLA